MTRFPRAALSGLALLSLALPAQSQTLPQSFDCVMDAARIIALSARSQGVIEEVLVQKGQRVARNDVIARTDSSLETAALRTLQARAASTAAIDQQKARVAFAQTQLTRAETLERQNAQSLAKVEELRYELSLASTQMALAEMEHNAAVAEADRARIAVENTLIRAPVAGVVTEITLSAGEFLSADRHVVVLAQTDPINVDAFLPAELYGQVRAGQTVQIHPEIPAGTAIKAQILSVDPVLDAASRTFGLRVALPNPADALIAGQRCTLDLDLS